MTACCAQAGKIRGAINDCLDFLLQFFVKKKVELLKQKSPQIESFTFIHNYLQLFLITNHFTQFLFKILSS
jgi:hypothetical protein